MNRRQRRAAMVALVSIAALAAAWAGVEFRRWSSEPHMAQPAPDDTGAVSQLVTVALATPEGEAKKLSDWRGKILVVNFWATWCPPCREEMPEFSSAQQKLASKGVQFIGIAIDDAANVAQFSTSTPVAYPLLIATADTPSLMAALGNRQQALPFTVIIGRDGRLVSNHLGRFTSEDLTRQLAPLI